jgi:hypothetical protein
MEDQRAKTIQLPDAVELRGQKFTFSFPSLARLRDVGRLLKINPLSRDLEGEMRKIDYMTLLLDETDPIDRAVALIFEGANSGDAAKLCTMEDYNMLIALFFVKGRAITMKFTNGHSDFVNSILKQNINVLPDMSLMSPSIKLDEEIRNS